MDDSRPSRKKDAAKPREPFRVKPFLRGKPGFNYDNIGEPLGQLDRLDRQEDGSVPGADEKQG